jgi:class 3 adenylate cyclase/tetratricopeptide (TPR) repeat protein
LDQAFQSWLDNLGLGQYARTFDDQDIDFRAVIHLTDDDLKELGLSLGHRRIMLASIRTLDIDQPMASQPGRQGSEPAAPSPGSQAERRQLTVMFCDLVGSTSLSRRLDPEQLRDVLRRYQNAIAAAVMGYDGYVAKFLGDGVLAYFGWPRAFEDQAERAIRAALDAIVGVEGVTLDDGSTLKARIGIASGEVVVGDLMGDATSDSEAVIGETPNLAARLQGWANTGKIVICDETRQLLGTAFTLEDIGHFEPKGFDEPVQAWRVVGEALVESRFEAAHGRDLTVLVGREHELGLMREGWTRARAGEGHVVLLSGEAGIGKSRMVQDFRTEIGDDAGYFLHYQCSPHHTNSAFHPVVQRLRREAGFASDDAADTKLDKLEALIKGNGDDVDTVAPVFAALLSLPGDMRYGASELSPQQLRNRMIEILIGRMLQQSRLQPVLCVIEDVHWGDPSMVEFIGEIMSRIVDRAVYMVITYRPDFTPPWPDYAHVSQLTLNRLGRGQAAEIAQSVAGQQLLDALIEQIVMRSDGVPLFVEELTKSVLETISAEQDATIDDIIPATLHSSLVARLDRLEEAKETAQVAAVIGRDVPYDLLAVVVDKTEQQLRADLDRLVVSGLVIRRGRPPAATYSFKHALVQDAAYGTILLSKRLHLHAKIVDVLEAEAGQNTIERIDTLAYHAHQAELWDKAFAYLYQAGVKAMDRAGLKEAVAQFEHALEVGANLPETRASKERMIDLRFELRNALWALGRFEAILTHLGDCAPMVTALNDPVRQGWVSVFESASLWQLGRSERALATAERALAVSRQADDLSLGVAAHFYLGCPLVTAGDYPRAEAMFQNVADMLKGYLSLERCGLPFVPAVISRSWLVWSLAERGEFEEGARHGEEAMQIAQEVGHPFNIAHTYYDLGYFHEIKGEIEQGVDALKNAVDLIEEWSLTYLSPFIKGFYGHVLALAGRTEEGIAYLEEAQDLYAAMGLGLFRSLVGIQLGEAYLIAGRLDEARTTIKQALALAKKRGERGHEGYGLRVLGDIAAHTEIPDAEAAMINYEAAMAAARALGMRPLIAQSELRIGRLLEQTGNKSKGRKHVDAANAMADEMGMTLWELPKTVRKLQDRL